VSEKGSSKGLEGSYFVGKRSIKDQEYSHRVGKEAVKAQIAAKVSEREAANA
jgi:hypothetical protein